MNLGHEETNKKMEAMMKRIEELEQKSQEDSAKIKRLEIRLDRKEQIEREEEEMQRKLQAKRNQ